MARFLQWSDLHREFGTPERPVPFPLPTDETPAGSVDAILIAGDLDRAVNHVRSLIEIHEAWSVPVVSIFGNHEPYGSSESEARARVAEDLAEARAAGHDIHVLDRDEMVIGDTRILGCTLWTDFEILGRRDDMMMSAEFVMNDYRHVQAGPERDGHQCAADTLGYHRRDRAWLLEALSKPFDGRTLVMTHHLPIPEVLASESGKGDYAPAYVSDMRADILGHRIDTWVSGHTHWARRGIVEGRQGPIAFTANMSGYVRGGHRQNTNFEPYRIIDTQAPQAGLDRIDIDDRKLAGLQTAQEVLRDLADESPAGPS
ncbi:hypothetical protein OCH239_09705 [Roseivivax halodurans JCM 10272]|uniref:Calcineurin-like phosphoesterase domain-containing protein n=1 Tax=Roseivivax halodurans JCM 10272 TaxID=1449350 RepID=X7EBT2_9RHOB|nr:metallophosphoesterase [Roseivivax halodurans]ETX13544.1 hypothetical protein OCH239_09705 [Roseivivax halodurans JCM 10272]